MMAGCEKAVSGDETCVKERGCWNGQLISFLSTKCQDGRACAFSFDETPFGSKADKIYLNNKFGAHPTIGACKSVPMSSEFSRSAVFGCEYGVLASQNKFLGYVRGACDASLVPLPASDKIIFAKGFDSAGISIEANQKLEVQKQRMTEPSRDGATHEVNYYYISLDKNKATTILRDDCFHF